MPITRDLTAHHPAARSSSRHPNVPAGPARAIAFFRRLLPLLLLFLAPAPAARAASFDRVVIDPGHGGHDRGGYRSYYFEKHLALDVAFRLEKYLKSRGVRSTLTRRRDVFITLDSRPALSNRTRKCIFVSIHFNSASRSGAAGIETFYNKSGSYRLASAVQNSMIRSTRATNRGVKHANFRVLRKNAKTAILVECGFLSNSSERRKCLDPKYRQRLAEAIGAGIVAYRKGS